MYFTKWVIGDAAKLRQIINNLVSNSLKYSHPGCVVNVNIREILHLHKPSFMVEVSDTGIGMDREFLKKLFNPYSREQRLSSVQGTGLGMSIVKNVVNIMGGDIKVKSTVNVGTTFTINLPFRLADDVTAKQVQQKLQDESNNDLALNRTDSGTKASTTSTVSKADDTDNQSADSLERLDPQARAFMDNFSLSGLNILIVEDNQLNMEIACDILGMKGVKLTCAWDGLQAVEIFNSHPAFTYDAILMDMRMPKMDGCEASATIRASTKEDARTIPIIACTANAFTEDIAATQNAGMNAHVSKPLDFTVLEHVLARVIVNRSDFHELVSLRAKQASGQTQENDNNPDLNSNEPPVAASDSTPVQSSSDLPVDSAEETSEQPSTPPAPPADTKDTGELYIPASAEAQKFASGDNETDNQAASADASASTDTGNNADNATAADSAAPYSSAAEQSTPEDKVLSEDALNKLGSTASPETAAALRAQAVANAEKQDNPAEHLDISSDLSSNHTATSISQGEQVADSPEARFAAIQRLAKSGAYGLGPEDEMRLNHARMIAESAQADVQALSKQTPAAAAGAGAGAGADAANAKAESMAMAEDKVPSQAASETQLTTEEPPLYKSRFSRLHQTKTSIRSEIDSQNNKK